MYMLIYIQIKSFYSAKENDVLIEQEAGWIPGPEWTFNPLNTELNPICQ